MDDFKNWQQQYRKLVAWIESQRTHYKSLSNEQVKNLEKISGFTWESR